MIRDFPVGASPALTARLTQWLELAPEQRHPVEVRLAATVMIVRDRAPGDPGDPGHPRDPRDPSGGPVEVFMLHRASTMAFAPDTLVFPGGGVDPRDGDESIPWRGANDLLWSARLGDTPKHARMFVCAAIRELFEETGVLLAGPAHSDELVDSGTPEWQEIRGQLVSRQISLAHVLHERRLVLRSDLLRAEAHWVTPEFEAKRFDTRIFAAIMPTDQLADDATSEAVSANWVDPAVILQRYADGKVTILPPTLTCLEHLVTATSAREFLDRDPVIERIEPELIDDGDHYVLRITTERS